MHARIACSLAAHAIFRCVAPMAAPLTTAPRHLGAPLPLPRHSSISGRCSTRAAPPAACSAARPRRLRRLPPPSAAAAEGEEAPEEDAEEEDIELYLDEGIVERAMRLEEEKEERDRLAGCAADVQAALQAWS